MLAAISSAAVIGVEAYEVTVEVDAAQGLPAWTIVGLPVGAVKESRERVAAALVNSGFSVPPRRVTVNLAPADRRKDGTAFDLAIALGILVATGQLSPDVGNGCCFLGELGLDGALREVRGVLPIAREVVRLRKVALVVPPANAVEATRVRSLRVSAPVNLAELVRQLRAGGPQPAMIGSASPPEPDSDVDFSDVVGQGVAKRALEVAAAGGHNVLLVGPPGAGKTMLARRLPTILPEMTEDEALEVVSVHSVAGTLGVGGVSQGVRPFRAPHHSISAAGLIGGGSVPRPGEVSLAHHGVLFLDEMLEFQHGVLESLRQPLEDGRVVIARASGAITFPARCTLIGATNPCPCGRAAVADGIPQTQGICVCTAADLARYRTRLSGPLADRIDMHIAVGAVALTDLDSRACDTERSVEVRTRVARARAAQSKRYRAHRNVRCNAHVSGRWLDASGAVSPDARQLVQRAAAALGLTARGYHRVLRVARTIADLDGEKTISAHHATEALGYRAPASTTAELAVGT